MPGAIALVTAFLFGGVSHAQDATTEVTTPVSSDTPAAPESFPETSQAAPETSQVAAPDTPATEALPATPQEPPAPPSSSATPILPEPSPGPSPQCPTEVTAAPEATAPLPQVSPLSEKRFLAQTYTALQLTYGKGSIPDNELSLGTMGFEAGSSMLVGPRFPGFGGGDWHGATIRLSAGLHSGAVVLAPAELENLQLATMLATGVVLGYQFLHFNPLAKTRQTAYGASAGYRLGYQYTIAASVVEFDVAQGGDVYQGLAVSFVRSRYYPAEDKFSLLLLSLSFDRMASSDINLFKFSIGRGF